jgi:hypothetical protein
MEKVLRSHYDCNGEGCKDCDNGMIMSWPYVNEDGSKFWKHSWLVSFDSHLGWDSAICVDADDMQNAIDEVADYAESQGWVGYFLDDEQARELDEFDEVSYVGNHGLPVWDGELNVKQLD